MPPYLKFKGGKGIATFFRFLLAVHPLTIPIAAAAILAGLFWAKKYDLGNNIRNNLLRSIFIFFKESAIYLIMILLLVLVMIPKQINRSLRFFNKF